METDPSASSQNLEHISINMRDLTIHFEEVTTKPDILYYFNPPTDHGSVADQHYKYLVISKTNDTKLENSAVKILDSQSLYQNASIPSSLDDDVYIHQDFVQNNVFQVSKDVSLGTEIRNMIDNKANLICEESLSESDILHQNCKLSGNDYKASCNDNMSSQSKAHKRNAVFSNVIRLYCSNCKTSTKINFNKNCPHCHATYLFQCVNCSYVYKRLITIQNHVKYECYKEFYYCSSCNYKTLLRLELLKHMKSAHPLPAKQQNVYKCLICCRKFKNQESIFAHERICSLKPVLHCQYCSFKTKFARGLSIHMQTKHTEFVPQNYLKCPDCGKKFKTISLLNTHINRVCGQKMKFVCNHCDFKTNRNFALAKHFQLHHSRFLKNKLLC